MKPIPFLILVLIASSQSARSQDGPNGDTSEPGNITTTARILGPIADGTPPPPEAPKPEYKIPARDILKTTSHQQGGRTVTIQRIKPIALPPPPPPQPVAGANAAPPEEFLQRLAEYREANPRSGLLIVSATVFRSSDAPPRTFVRYYPEGLGTEIRFWSSADFALIAGGIQSFEDTEGHKHHLLMSWGNVDLDGMSAPASETVRSYVASDIPNLPQGEASFKIIGEQPPAAQLVSIQSLHEIYNKEHDRLVQAHQGREQARAEREAYLKANPPQPRDITINYWRTERPAAKEEGASR